MLYSVYRPELKVYDYYQTPATPDDARNPPNDDVAGRTARGGRDGMDLGVSSERAGYRLPGHARRIGQGLPPRGMVVTITPQASMGSVASDATFGTLAAVAAIGGVAILVWGKKLLR
jgi:hypothetical protein